jgi:hypothetical protein
VSALKPQVSPAGLAALSDLNSSLDRTIAEVALYSAKVDDLSTKLVSSEEQVAWEREKRMKALKEVWGWRLLALTIAGITLAAVGIKTGWRFFL